MGDTRLDERKFGVFKRASASRACPETYLQARVESQRHFILVKVSRSTHSRNDRAVNWRICRLKVIEMNAFLSLRGLLAAKLLAAGLLAAAPSDVSFAGRNLGVLINGKTGKCLTIAGGTSPANNLTAVCNSTAMAIRLALGSLRTGPPVRS